MTGTVVSAMVVALFPTGAAQASAIARSSPQAESTLTNAAPAAATAQAAPLKPRSDTKPAVAATLRAAVSVVSLSVKVNLDKTLTLTAVADSAVGAGGLSLAIYDRTAAKRIDYCSTNCSGGTTLVTSPLVPSGSTSSISGLAHQYYAVVATGVTGYPATGVAATSGTITADPWQIVFTSTRNADNTFTITATTNYSISASLYYLSLFDLTTQVRLGYCSSNCTNDTSLSYTSVPQAGTTALSEVSHQYQAVLGTNSGTYPVSNIAAESQVVTQERWTLSLSAVQNANRTFTLTATTNWDVPSSAYYLSIYDKTTGRRLSYCNDNCLGGITDQAPDETPVASSTALSEIPHEYIAVVGSNWGTYDDTISTHNIAATATTVTRPAWTVSLVASGNVLTATTNYDVRSAGYYVMIFDIATGRRTDYCNANCTDGYTFSTTLTKGFADSYVAMVASLGLYPPSNIAARSGLVTPRPTGALISELIGGCNPALLLDCAASAGDPIDLDSGAYFESRADLQIPGRGVALALARTYDTRAATLAGRLGYGWRDSYDAGLTVDTSTEATAGQVTVRQQNGSRVVFAPDGRGGYLAPSRILATLVRNTDGSWLYTVRRTTRYTFGAAGNLTAIRDLNGYSTTLAYDASGRLSTITDPAGRALTYAYDMSNRVTSVTDALPRVVRYSYDAAGNLSTVTDADNRVWSFAYDTAHRLTSATDPRSATLSNEYDSLGRVIKQTDRRGKVMTFAYGPETDGSHTTTVTHPRGNKDVYSYTNHMVLTVVHGSGSAEATTESRGYDPVSNGLNSLTTAPGHTTSWTYDGYGNQLSRTNALGQTTSWTYSALNLPLTETDPLTITTTRTYDSAGNPLTVSRPLAGSSPSQTATIRYVYGDAAHPGDVKQTVDPRGKATTFAYDARGNLTSVTDPTGRRATNVYNVIGWRTSSVSPAGNATGATPAQWTTTFGQFTGFGEPRSVRDPLGQTDNFVYDAAQNLTEATDADGRRTATTFDAEGRPTLVTRPDGSTQGTAYDDNGNTSAQTDGLTRATTYSYDALDRLVRTQDPLNRVSTRSYDAAGNTRTVVTPDTGTGTLTTTLGYDTAGQLSSLAYSDGTTPAVAYTYDAAGHRLTMQDGSGTTRYVTDSLGRLTQVTNGAGKIVGYGYDLAGNATSLIYPNGSVVTRGFDDSGRLTSTKDWVSATAVTFGYDNEGNWATTSSPNGVTGTRTFDRTDRLIGVGYAKAGATLGGYTYTRTPGDLLSTSTPAGGAPGGAASYAYTVNGSLKSTAGASSTNVWAYDAAGRMTKAPNGTTLTYDAADQLTTSTPVTGSATTYGYDARGDRTSAMVGSATATRYDYDQASRLSRFTTPAGTVTTYTYNGDGLRASRNLTGGTRQVMTWDVSTSEVPLLLAEDTTSYLYGPSDVPVAQISGSTVSALHPDQLGSTSLVTNGTGTVVGTYVYDPYGKATFTGTVSTRLQFAGEYTDPESGLIHLRARSYDPATGQFLTRDPLAGLTRWAYGYAAGNPLSWTDPTGLFCWGLDTSCLLENTHDGASVVSAAADVCSLAVVTAPACGSVGLLADGVTIASGGIRVSRGEQSREEFGIDLLSAVPGLIATRWEVKAGRSGYDLLDFLQGNRPRRTLSAFADWAHFNRLASDVGTAEAPWSFCLDLGTALDLVPGA